MQDHVTVTATKLDVNDYKNISANEADIEIAIYYISTSSCKFIYITFNNIIINSSCLPTSISTI